MTHHKRECGSDLFAIARRDDVTSAFARQHCADRSAQEFVPGIVALAARKRQDRHEAFLWNGLDQPGADTGQGAATGRCRRSAGDKLMTLGTSRPHARLTSSLRKVAPRSETTMRSAVGARGAGFVHNRRRLNEELIRPVLEALPRPGHVDDGIDHEIGDVDVLRTHLARDRFRKDTLRGLGRREASEIRLALISGLNFT